MPSSLECHRCRKPSSPQATVAHSHRRPQPSSPAATVAGTGSPPSWTDRRAGRTPRGVGEAGHEDSPLRTRPNAEIPLRAQADAQAERRDQDVDFRPEAEYAIPRASQHLGHVGGAVVGDLPPGEPRQPGVQPIEDARPRAALDLERVAPLDVYPALGTVEVVAQQHGAANPPLEIASHRNAERELMRPE